jgi:sugar phosphate isomerase/epimerase
MRQWPVEQGIAFLRDLGVAHGSWSFSQFARGDGTLAERVRTNAPPTVTVGIGGLDLLASPEQTRANLTPLLDLAQALASPIAFTVSGPTPSRMPGDEALRALIANLAPAVAEAKARGVWLAVENNGAATRDLGFIQTLADAALLARETGAGIALELQNCWTECQLARIFREIVAHIAIVQVSDFRVGEELRFNRRVPGDGSIPLEWLIGELLAAGYRGLFEIELLGPAITDEGPEAAMRRGIDWLSERLTAWGV